MIPSRLGWDARNPWPRPPTAPCDPPSNFHLRLCFIIRMSPWISLALVLFFFWFSFLFNDRESNNSIDAGQETWQPCWNWTQRRRITQDNSLMDKNLSSAYKTWFRVSASQEQNLWKLGTTYKHLTSEVQGDQPHPSPSSSATWEGASEASRLRGAQSWNTAKSLPVSVMDLM